MSKNNIDANNERVLKDMEDIILGNNNSNDDGGGDDNNNVLLRKMLLPLYRIKTSTNGNGLSQFSQPSPNDENESGGGIKTKTIVESSSLIKVLLRIDTLQPTLLSALLSKIPELSFAATADETQNNDNNNNVQSGGGNSNNEDDIPRLILSNIKWLDHIIDYNQLSNSFVECLTLLASNSTSCTKTRGVLLDVIGMLPDVMSDCITFGGGSSMSNNEDEEEEEEEGEDGSSSCDILSTLQSLRAEDSSLLIPILDAMSSLPLSQEQIEVVVNDALEALGNVESWGLPALTTFLLNHCPASGGKKKGKSMALDVIEEIRKLPLGNYDNDENNEEGDGMMDVDQSLGRRRRRGITTTSNNSNSTNNTPEASACLTIESISRGLAHRPDLTSTLLKSIKDTTPSSSSSTSENNNGLEYHPPADIWLLACAATSLHNRPKVKSIFKSKANCGLFTSRLLREALCGNGVALSSLFDTLCDLADGLLRTSSSGSSLDSSAGSGVGGGSSSSCGAACDLGVTLYGVLFEEFSEPMQRQEIVGRLVTHVGSGVNVNMGEVDSALRVFCSIVDKRGDAGEEKKNKVDGPMALRPYTPFLTSMLDHLKSMSSSQVRRLFLLLFAVGYGDGDEGEGSQLGAASAAGGGGAGGACSDVHIVITKHLSLASFSMKRIVSLTAVCIFCVSSIGDADSFHTSYTCLHRVSLALWPLLSHEAHNFKLEMATPSLKIPKLRVSPVALLHLRPLSKRSRI